MALMFVAVVNMVLMMLMALLSLKKFLFHFHTKILPLPNKAMAPIDSCSLAPSTIYTLPYLAPILTPLLRNYICKNVAINCPRFKLNKFSMNKFYNIVINVEKKPGLQTDFLDYNVVWYTGSSGSQFHVLMSLDYQSVQNPSTFNVILSQIWHACGISWRTDLWFRTPLLGPTWKVLRPCSKPSNL